MRYRRQCGIVFLLTILVYLSSFPGAFHFDDFALMLENPTVTGAGFDYSIFLDNYGGRPFTLWTFHVCHQLFGKSPLPFHLVNVLLHALAATLFCWLLLSYGDDFFPPHAQAGGERGEWGKGWLAVGAALLFALHPLQTQAVNYNWSRSMLLMAVFGFASALAARKRPWLSLILFQMAIWSRTEGLMFLPLLGLVNPRRWKAPLVLAGANVVLFASGMALHAPRELGWSHPDPVGYWISQPVALLKYFLMMIWPRGQTIDHDFRTVPLETGMAAAIGLAALVGLAWKNRHRFPEALFGLVWMLAFLLPSCLIPNSDAFNESRIYVALGGVAILAAGAARTALPLSGRRRLPVKVAGGVVLASLAWLTVGRNRLWSDDVLIWREAVRLSPDKARANYNLGFALAQRGSVESAEAAFRTAHDLNPNDDLSYAALGYCAEVQHRLREARDLYEHALQLNPGNDYARDGAARVSGAWSDLKESDSKIPDGNPTGADNTPAGY